MTSKIVVFFKIILKYWFIYLVLAILIIYLYYPTHAIWITVISIIIIALTYIPSLYLRLRLVRFMKQYYRIDDKTIARLLDKPLRKIQNKMFNLSQRQVSQNFLIRLLRKKSEVTQKQAKKKWLIVFINKQYIFYHMETIEKLKALYLKGYNYTEILEELKEFEIETREEIKSIVDTLIKNQRLSDREISVKDRQEKKRFEAI